MLNVAFRLVLGDTFGYSEGFWKEDTRSLDEAQHNNFDMICQKLRLQYGLVGSQNNAMRMLMKGRNFRGKLTLVERDHRELADEPARYDRFVSIGVHEHAGRDCNENGSRASRAACVPEASAASFRLPPVWIKC